MRFELLLDCSTTMATLTVKTQEFGLKEATGLREGAAEDVVLVSDRLDCPRVSYCEISMLIVAAIVVGGEN